MLARIPVSWIKSGKVSRRDGYIVIAMLHFPRYVKTEQRDEYLRSLAPPEELFTEFKALERSSGDHDAAFATVAYEERFEISDEGMQDLQRLSKMSLRQNVYLVCQCTLKQRCHCDLLLLLAQTKFSAYIMRPEQSYVDFQKRFTS